MAEEAIIAANGTTYVAGVATTALLPGFSPTPGVTVTAAAGAGGIATYYTLSAVHASCGATAWTFTSATGLITGADSNVVIRISESASRVFLHVRNWQGCF